MTLGGIEQLPVHSREGFLLMKNKPLPLVDQKIFQYFRVELHMIRVEQYLQVD
jgi:hypothetical protein